MCRHRGSRGAAEEEEEEEREEEEEEEEEEGKEEEEEVAARRSPPPGPGRRRSRGGCSRCRCSRRRRCRGEWCWSGQNNPNHPARNAAPPPLDPSPNKTALERRIPFFPISVPSCLQACLPGNIPLLPEL
ncbi:histone-lysine N-methyltransferase EHMT2-like isoform X2 [Grus americana]|uniref:histone-lysine N-methyltransferase EHMT2-like isoform X2 n=1 Tax=Grus americana TaxID=9117 RepID=UPI002407E57F|nr:histone-lysine N-methyltransferase EHMT2-like isoform X2 [Grus americana]